MAKIKTRTIRNETYILVVLRVIERDGHGRPSKCEVGFDDSVFKIKGGEEFITAWVLEANAKKTKLLH